MDEPTTTSDVDVEDTGADDIETDDDAQLDATDTEAGEVDETTPNEPSAFDDETKAWAEKKGLDLSDQAAIVKSLREAEKMAHNATVKRSELERQFSTPSGTDYDGDEVLELRERLTQLEAQSSVANFYLQNPEAKEYDAQMAALVKEKPHLRGDLESLYLVARAQAGTDKAAGGKEALQSVATKLKASAPAAAATTPGQQTGLSDEIIANMPMDEYARRQPEIDEWLKSTS